MLFCLSVFADEALELVLTLAVLLIYSVVFIEDLSSNNCLSFYFFQCWLWILVVECGLFQVKPLGAEFLLYKNLFNCKTPPYIVYFEADFTDLWLFYDDIKSLLGNSN